MASNPPVVIVTAPGWIGPRATASRSTASPACRFTPAAIAPVMKRLSLAGTTMASTSSWAISPCHTSISIGFVIGTCPGLATDDPAQAPT